MDKLSNLEDLKFRENPVLKNETAETARQLIIARIAKLKILNSTEILHDERRGAEYDYLKLYLPKWLEIENDAERRTLFTNEHPRYPVLVDSVYKLYIFRATDKYFLNLTLYEREFDCYFFVK